MRICILADHHGSHDEGMRNTAIVLSDFLKKRHEIKLLSPYDVLSPRFWIDLKKFQPEIVHYIPGPSIFSFFIMWIIGSYCKSKTVLSATNSAFLGLSGFRSGLYYGISTIFQFLIPLFKPSIILVQSTDVEKMFISMGIKTGFLPSGVDLDRFKPVPLNRKKQLRQKYGLKENGYYILHCGSFQKQRNVSILSQLHDKDTEIIVVGSSLKVDKRVYNELKRKHCIVWSQYIEDIEEVYQLSDCFVFPTVDRRGSIDLPLSIMEAMSCNLPIVTTKFGALSKMFSEGDGFFFISNIKELQDRVNILRNSHTIVRTREKVSPYSWSIVACQLEMFYKDII